MRFLCGFYWATLYIDRDQCATVKPGYYQASSWGSDLDHLGALHRTSSWVKSGEGMAGDTSNLAPLMS